MPIHAQVKRRPAERDERVDAAKLVSRRELSDNLNDMTASVKERPWSLIRIKQPKDRNVPL